MYYVCVYSVHVFIADMTLYLRMQSSVYITDSVQNQVVHMLGVRTYICIYVSKTRP